MKKIILLTTTLFGFLSGTQAVASAEDLRIFARCYNHLTGRPLALNHPDRAAVLNGTKSPEALCIAMLDKVAIESPSFTVGSDEESKLVLRQLFDFHRTWFPATIFELMQGYNHKSSWGTPDIYDSNEGALALTYMLFNPTKRYEHILTDAHGYYGLRELDTAKFDTIHKSLGYAMPSYRLTASNNYASPHIVFRMDTTFNNTNYSTTNMVEITPVQVGELIGVKPDDRNTTVANYAPMIKTFTGAPNSEALKENAVKTPGMVVGFNLYATSGGGVLGQHSNMIMNWGFDPGRVNDGAVGMPRRWVQRTMESLLCTTFPTLRTQDVVKYLDTSGDADVADFRTGTACLECHSTFDQLAATGRNYLVSSSDISYRFGLHPTIGKIGKNAQIMGRFEASISTPYNWSSKPVVDYTKQTSLGRVYMRTFSGKLVDQPVSNIAGAGAVLSQVDDLYQCAAKRYFQYLTGIKVELYDRGDPRNFERLSKTTAEEKMQRIFIETVAADLKKTQSLKNVIKDIIKSPYYRNPHASAEGGE